MDVTRNFARFFLFAVFFTSFAGLQAQDSSSWAQRKLVADSADKANIREIFFATSRPSYVKKDGNLHVYNEISYEEPEETPIYGAASVYFPLSIHNRGQLERTDNDKETFRILRLRKEDRFPQSQKILIFIHGYNNGFDDALLQSAQLSQDLSWAEHLIISYSWLSRGNIAMYLNDRGFLDKEGQCLSEFLRDLIFTNPTSEIHILAHSMGNEVAIRGLALLKEDLVRENKNHLQLFNNIIFAAPDVSVNDFYEYINYIGDLAKNLTHYFSSKDLPISLSPFANWGKTRAGGQAIFINGLDTIDTDAINSVEVGLGHNYFAATEAILNDVEQLLKKPETLFLLPEQRHSQHHRIIRVDGDKGVYWKIRP